MKKLILLLLLLSTHSFAQTQQDMDKLWNTLLQDAGINAGDNEAGVTALPIGIARQINGTIVVIALDSLRADMQGAMFGAFTSLQLPGTKQPLAFSSRGIRVGPGGLKVAAEGAKLLLETNYRFSISSKIDMLINADGSNYVEWNCSGFKGVHLKGVFEFDSELLIPAGEQFNKNPDGTVLPPVKKLQASFEVYGSSLNDLIMAVNMPAFQSPKSGWIFEAKNMLVDLSDFNNPEKLVFPKDYNTGLSVEDVKLWRGFFAESVSVTFPEELQDKSSAKKKFSIAARNLLIDNMGVSVDISAGNINVITAADSWPISIENLRLNILKNQLRGGGLDGKINVPILDNEPLDYTAEMYQRKDDLDYLFSIKVNTAKEYRLPALSAKASIDKGSKLEVEKKNGNFTASAILNGKLSLDHQILKTSGLTYNRLTLTSKAPFLTDGIIGLTTESSKLGSFPVSFDSISLDINKGNPILAFNMKVNLMDALSFSGATRMKIYAEQDPGKFTLKPSRFELESLSIKADMGSFKLDGTVDFYNNHPIYGDGFHGNLELGIGSLLTKMKAQMYFGYKDFRYWQASLTIPTKIPIPPIPAFYLTSLKGGLAYKMSRPSTYKVSYMENSDKAEDTYIPNGKMGLSFLAGVGFKFEGNILAGKAEFNIAFTSSGGLSSIGFDGDAAFFAKSDEFVKNSKPSYPLMANLSMKYNNEEKIFDAKLGTKINIANLVKGGGDAVIHISPSKWYMYVGRPSAPWGLDFLGIAKFQSYFMTGTQLDAMPTPPSNVSSVVSSARSGMMSNMNLVNEGKGFAFGSRFDYNFGFGQNGGFIYAYIALGAGADIMLRNYGTASCEGRQGPIGIDGWYASGQAYAYMDGALGIRVRKKKFDILSLSMAALLKAELPNPAYFQGNVGARYKLLGGLIKGSVNLDVTVGEQCKLVLGGNELGVDMIGDITPSNKESDVSIFASPQVAFNTSIDTEFRMENILNKVETYRVKLDELTLSDKKGKIDGSLTWNSDKSSVVFEKKEVMPPKEAMNVNVKIHIEKKEGNGNWVAFTDEKGKQEFESKSAAFTTGLAPDHITADNIKYSYPIETQYNFHPKEYGKGYIQLNQGISYLFQAQDDKGNKLEYSARFTDGYGRILEAGLSYDAANNKVDMNIPATLNLSSVYKMQVIRKIKPTTNSASNVNVGSIKLENTETMQDTEIADNKLKGSLVQAGEKDLHTINFRTSSFATFKERLNGASSRDFAVTNKKSIWLIAKRFSIGEYLDKFEAEGGKGHKALVASRAEGKEKWYTSFLNPVIYSDYMKGDASIKLDRDVSILGTPPLNAMLMYNQTEYPSYTLNANQITNGSAFAQKGDFFAEYDVSHYAFIDYMELLNKVVKKSYSVYPQNVKSLLSAGGYVDLMEGNYSFFLEYRLPGTNIITTSQKYTIKF